MDFRCARSCPPFYKLRHDISENEITIGVAVCRNYASADHRIANLSGRIKNSGRMFEITPNIQSIL
jgi:hypothetical protein